MQKNASVCFEFLGQNWKQKKPIKFFVIVGGVFSLTNKMCSDAMQRTPKSDDSPMF